MHENLECVICSESLVDPRALPCGHSYCGPPRFCLYSLDNSEGGLRCAVCQKDHNLGPNDIKPLYGIRDYLQSSSKQKSLAPSVACPVHQNEECTLWCKSCHTSICDLCFEGDNDDHAVRKLKKYLVEEIERFFGQPLNDAMSSYRDRLKEVMATKSCNVEKLKADVTATEAEIVAIEQQKVIMDDYFKLISKGDHTSGRSTETSLLLMFWKLDWNMLDSSSSHPKDRKEKVVTQMEPKPSTSLDSSSTCSSCNCSFERNLSVSFSFPAVLHILQRNPLKIGPSNAIIFCPFKFQIHAELVRHRNPGGDTLLKTSLKWLNDDVAIASRFCFMVHFTLCNWGDKERCVKKLVEWVYPNYKQLFWHSITGCELLNPWEKWISEEKDGMGRILILLELTRFN